MYEVRRLGSLSIIETLRRSDKSMYSQLDNEGTDFSEAFYVQHASRYAKVAHEFLQSVYIESSDPGLKGDLDLQHRLKELIPGKCGLDAGFGAGARDVHAFWTEGYDIWGIDAVPENMAIANEWHPEIQNRLKVHDLRKPLPFEDACFDFVMCNAVIQHIEPDDVFETVLPEFVRVLRPKGILQLMFKNGVGTEVVYDKDYCANRCFRLYEENEILDALENRGMNLVESEHDRLGGLMRFVDPKGSHHCVMFLCK